MVFDPLNPAPAASAGGSGGDASVAGSGGRANAEAPFGGALSFGGFVPEAGAGGQAGAGGEGGVIEEGPCTTNAECSARHFDEKYRCRPDGECVPLATLECPLVYGDSNDDNAVFIGAYAPRDGTSLAESTAVQNYRLAIDEFDRAGNLPGNGRDRRALVTIVCDSDPTQFDRSMRHLTKDVQVPAVLAAIDTQPLLEAFREYGDDRVFFLSPFGGSIELAGEMDDGLLWSMLGQPADFVPIYTTFLIRLEQYIRRTFPTIERLRVAVIRSEDTFSAELADLVLPSLRFNTKDVTANLEAGDFIVHEIPAEDPIPAIDAAVLAIHEFKPHVVVSLANEVFIVPTGVLPQVEETWRAFNAEQPRPFWVMSPKNTSLDEQLGPIVRRHTLLDGTSHQRFLAIGAAPADDRSLYEAYMLRLLAKFSNARLESENLYDAFYFLVYAIYAAGNVAELNGRSIARGMLRLMSPEQSLAVDVAPWDISAAFGALSAPQNDIRLMGTLGPPDFDIATGMRIDPGSITCFDDMAVIHNHVLRYNRESGVFSGSFEPCYPGF